MPTEMGLRRWRVDAIDKTMKPRSRSGDIQTISDIADFFDLPPSYVLQTARRVCQPEDVRDKNSEVDRFRVERALDGGLILGVSWAAAALGITKETVNACLGNVEGLAWLPLPSGSLPPSKRQAGDKNDERRIFNLDMVSDWATKLIRAHLGYSLTMSNVTSKALKLRDALKAAGVATAEVEFCSFESKHLTELKIDPANESDRTVSSTLCCYTMTPIWVGNGCWLDNGKPISMKPDLVSYEEVWLGRVKNSEIQPASLDHFRQLTSGWGPSGGAKR